MPEKVIHEVRFIETDDGFRVEFKGDKERMIELGVGPGMGPCFGLGLGRRFRGGRRPWRRGRDFGPWGSYWQDDEPERDDPRGEPPTEE